MTSAEAIRELRGLAAAEMAGPRCDWAEVVLIARCAREVVEYGYDPIAELMLRRFRRHAGMREDYRRSLANGLNHVGE